MSAVAMAVACAACSAAASAGAPRTAGFWFAADAFVLPDDIAARIGGPLTAAESEVISAAARTEIARAFSGVRIRVTSARDAFWRIEVSPTLARRAKQPLPHAGESLAMGPFGGRGSVNLGLVALMAARYADPATSRQDLVTAIGRGAGSVAVHELMHQILGPASVHTASDDSYEYSSPDRAAQYYGTLRWAAAWPRLQRTLGVSTREMENGTAR